MPKTTAHPRPVHTAPPPRRRERSNRVLPAVIGLAGARVIVAVRIGLALGPSDKATLGSQTGEVRVAGAALTPYTAGTQDASVGAGIPQLRGNNFDGEPMTIAPTGRPRIVMFVAHWCTHCQAEVPRVVDWLAAGRLSGADLVAVSTGVNLARPNYPPSAWLEREDWTIPTMKDDTDGTAGTAFGLTGYPYFVAVTAEGTVAARASGELTLPELQALIAAAQS